LKFVFARDIFLYKFMKRFLFLDYYFVGFYYYFIFSFDFFW